jgi:tetratricopeptide (TPR) repeat protein
MTLRKLLIGFVVVLVLQCGLFAWNYSDLLYFRNPTSTIAQDGVAAFIAQADEALKRPTLTRQHLETIADTARALGQTKYEITAVQRRLLMDPHENAIRLRLADLYRRNGQLDRAEALYQEVLVRGEMR